MNKNIFLLVCMTLLSSCTQLPKNRDNAKELLLQKVKPSLEKIVFEESLINPTESSSYPIVQMLPGNSFNPRKTIRSPFDYDSKGRLLLIPGDYTFPVMTYCMRSSASSPSGHIYSLSKLEGKRTKIIRELNLLAPAKYFTDEIQMVSWGLQNGLSYEELGKQGQEMIDNVVPYLKSELKESLLVKIEKKWNQISSLSGGSLPSFESSVDNIEEELGELGKRIREMRDFKKRLREVGYDYTRLSELIDTTTRSQIKGETPWSKVSNNVYARFLTEGSFGEIGYIQLRIVSSHLGRTVNSVNNEKEVLDLVSLQANPNNKLIQPLTFSPLYGVGGTITLTPSLSRHPLAGALLLAAVLSAKYIDWEAFSDLQDLLKDSQDRDVQKEIENGQEALRKEHDILEKPLKEAGIISGKTEDTSRNENGRVRNYTKEGGEKQLQKDFHKINGNSSKAKDGTETKRLPDGTTIVKRPKTKEGPTLEVQAPENDSRYPDDGIKVKVRYQ